MRLPRTEAVATRVLWLDSAGSTNSELMLRARADPAGWPAGSVLLTDDQRAGRGRQGRAWTAPAGTALAISLLVDPAASAPLGWVPLVAGAAMARTLRMLGVPAVVKWPNDVLVRDRKICGVLAEVLPDERRTVVGAGLNTTLPVDRLPVPTATSLAVEGTTTDVDAVVSAYIGELRRLLALLGTPGGEPLVAATVRTGCGTIGRRVRVVLPGGQALVGVATAIADDGRLLVQCSGGPVVVGAGDVEHLRYE